MNRSDRVLRGSAPAAGPFRIDDPHDLLETHLARTSRSAHWIYGMVLLLIVGGLASLGLVTVDVYVSAAGVIQPISEKHALTVGVDGVVEFVMLEPASTVERNQVVLRIRARPTEARQKTLAADLTRTEQDIGDLTYLLSRSGNWSAGRDGLETREHLQEARELEARLGEIDIRIDSGREQLTQTRALHEVRSPVRGTLEEVVSLSPGSFVRAGTRLAVVSPDRDLVAEVLVAPSDMGFIRLGEPVLLRIHAFNAREWGVLEGRVESIGRDTFESGAGPAFRVRASMDRSFLELPNGHRGLLRKGMTLEARFLVTRRTLFQLLGDRVQDWILSPVAGD
jgi:multidrug efflux pump subunit AcrA (membrane-fusion protein)